MIIHKHYKTLKKGDYMKKFTQKDLKAFMEDLKKNPLEIIYFNVETKERCGSYGGLTTLHSLLTGLVDRGNTMKKVYRNLTMSEGLVRHFSEITEEMKDKEVSLDSELKGFYY